MTICSFKFDRDKNQRQSENIRAAMIQYGNHDTLTEQMNDLTNYNGLMDLKQDRNYYYSSAEQSQIDALKKRLIQRHFAVTTLLKTLPIERKAELQMEIENLRNQQIHAADSSGSEITITTKITALDNMINEKKQEINSIESNKYTCIIS